MTDSDTTNLTTEQVTNLFGDFELTFDSYYKFCFVFSGKDDSMGIQITAVVGGNAEEIYREEIVNNEVRKLGNPEQDWDYVCIFDTVNALDNEKIIYEYSGW